MPFASALAERLAHAAQAPATPELAIAQWRLLVDTGTSTEVGLKDNHPGGPYEAPNVVTGTRGEVYLRWRDGKVSTGTVDRTTLENLQEDLALWRQAAYEDSWAPEVLGPQDYLQIPLSDQAVSRAVYDDPEPLFTLLERFRRELPPYEAERVSGSVTVSASRRRLISSEGLDHESATTAFGAYADTDHRAYDYLSLRRLPSAEEIARLIREVGETNRLLRREATLKPGRQAIVFAPPATDAMLSKFVLGNLDGQRVLNGQSAFSREQFAAQARVFAPGFDLAIDPTAPLSPGSYELTREGVPARRVELIRDGALLTPLLDLKHAKKAALPPTPFPRGGSSLRFGGASQPLDALISGIDRGILVYQMLGLHTQDTARGAFSLTVSQGLVIASGKLVGHAKAIIAGNFLQALAEDFRWGLVAGKDVPALQIMGDVTAG